MGSISRHITPLVINSLGGGHTQTHTHTDVRTETILKNQACAWFKTESAMCSLNHCLSSISVQTSILTLLIVHMNENGDGSLVTCTFTNEP